MPRLVEKMPPVFTINKTGKTSRNRQRMKDTTGLPDGRRSIDLRTGMSRIRKAYETRFRHCSDSAGPAPRGGLQRMLRRAQALSSKDGTSLARRFHTSTAGSRQPCAAAGPSLSLPRRGSFVTPAWADWPAGCGRGLGSPLAAGD
jgi:hypothetical protein